jgi:hypothetical protein
MDEVETKSNGLGMLFGFLLLFFSVVFFYFLFSRSDDQIASVDEPKASLDELSPNEQFEAIGSFKDISTPEILDTTSIHFNTLPQYIQDLFMDLGEQFTVRSLKYKDGRTGFDINYIANNSVRNLYRSFFNNSKTPWPPVDGGRTESSAFLNIENKEYLIVAKFLEINDTRSSVNVTIVIK